MYEIALFSAPIINIYSPDFKSEEGVKINEICFDFPLAIENDCSLKDPVEFPRSPVGVKVPDFIMLIVLSEEEDNVDDVCKFNLISALFPLAIVTSFSEDETENGTSL
jgi:hypothetical protein